LAIAVEDWWGLVVMVVVMVVRFEFDDGL